MSGTLTLLGSGGWIPSPERHTPCALLRDTNQALVIDAGSGLHRLVAEPQLLDGLDRIDLILTHFHLDHIAGLAYLAALPRPGSLTVWAPGRLLYSSDSASLLTCVSKEPFNPCGFDTLGIPLREIGPRPLELGAFTVDHRRQERHSAPTLGLRVNDTLAWITDTAADPGTAAFAEGVELLCHEAWYSTARPHAPAVHSSGRDAAEVAEAAGVKRLCLIHLNPIPGYDEEAIGEAVAHRQGTVAACDGLGLML